MPLKEKNRTKTKIAPPGAFSVASPCTFCSLQAAHPGGSSLSSTPCPGPRRGGVPLPCLGGTTNAQQAPTLPSLSPPSPAPVPLQFLDLHTCLDSGSADFFPAAVSAQRKQNPPPGGGGCYQQHPWAVQLQGGALHSQRCPLATQSQPRPWLFANQQLHPWSTLPLSLK